MSIIYAHSVDGRPRSDWETLEDHAQAVALRAACFAKPFGGEEVAATLGWVHDLGKIKPRFQAKLAGDRNAEPHSGEGARLLLVRCGGIGPLLAACVAGHHSGLPDMTEVTRRLASIPEPVLPDWMPAPAMPAPFGPLTGELSHFTLQFAVRMLFSCLVDADEMETAAFHDGLAGRAVTRAPGVVTKAHRNAFDAFVQGFAGKSGPVNALRSEILTHVRAQAASRPGIFTLTVPTGGGKTLTSLGFALEHALTHGLERVIHVIPYTSIVEQTADVFGQVLGPEQVVEHHSSFDWDGVDDDEDLKRLRRVTRNWDAPVIVTTAVQFFESLFAAHKRRCAKLHNIARAVIVIDEAQTMPRKLLRPCLAAIQELTRHYGATVVLSTATQPVLTRNAGFVKVPEALEDVRELAPEPRRLYAALRRTRVTNAGPQDDAALVDRIAHAPQVLTIVNNRRHARSLYDNVSDLPGACHLSTSMTPQHRRHVLAEIRARLTDRQPVRLISTSLVEAGVDLDFPLVLRAAAGIDSIAQAAGRCNREGGLDGLGEVIIFTPASDGANPPEEVSQMAEIGAKILAAHKDDPLSEMAVADYFRALLWQQGSCALDAARVDPDGVTTIGIMKEIAETGDYAFRFDKIARAFRMIDDMQAPVIVRGGRWGIPDKLLGELTYATGTGGIARALQPFVVTLPHHIRHSLKTSRAASLWREDLFGREFLLLDHAGLYDDRAGMRMDRFEDLGVAIV